MRAAAKGMQGLDDMPARLAAHHHNVEYAVARLGLGRDAQACALVWLPLKDLDSFDRLLSRVEALRPTLSLAVQARLRPLTDPMKMNGAALLIVGGGLAEALEAPARAVAAWVAGAASAQGGRAVVERFGG